MLTIAVVGSKDSGKTTTVEELIQRLVARGLRVASVKHTSHHHTFDTPGKDSHRHRQAGASLTVAMSLREIAVFSEPDLLGLPQLQEMMTGRFDIWVVEGHVQSGLPKVLVTRHLKQMSGGLPKNIIATFGPERIDASPIHFDETDYDGLADFIAGIIPGP